MLETLWYEFVATWLLGLVSLLLGRFIRAKNYEFPITFSSKLLVYLKVWAFVFLVKIFFNYLAYLINYSDEYSYFNFLLPIIAGTLFAKQLLKKTVVF